MESKFSTLVVCVTVVQIFLAISPSTASTEIPAECELDFAILQTYKAIAVLQAEKALEIISAREYEVFSAEAGVRDNSYSTQTCKDELGATLRALFDATSAAIAVVYPEAFSAVTTIQTSGNATATGLSESICSAIVLATEKNSSTASSEIQASANKHTSGAMTFNAAYFEVLKNGYTHSKFELAFRNAKSKAASELMLAIKDIFVGTETLISSGARADSEDKFSAIETTNNRAFSKFSAYINVKFEFLQSLLAASCMIQFGIVNASSSIHIDEPGISAVNPSDNQGEFMSEDCHSQAARKTADSEGVEGMKLIFSTMQTELAEIPKAKPKSYENDDFEIAEATTTAAYIGCVNASMDAILIINPKATSAIRAAMHAAAAEVKKGVNDIYDAITLINEKDPSKILTKIQALEDGTTLAASAAVGYIYDALYLAEIPAEVLTEIKHAQKESITQVKNECHAIFNGIRIRMAEIIAGTQVESNHSTSPFELARTEASVTVQCSFEIIFDAIRTVYEACVDDEAKETANLSAIQFHRERSLSNVTTAVKLVFHDVLAFTQVCPGIKNIPKYNSTDIKTGNSGTIALWSALYDIMFCRIPSHHPLASLKYKNAVNCLMEKAINAAYMGISLTRTSNPSSRTLTELQALENTTECSLIKLAVDMFAAIRESENHDAQTEAALDRHLKIAIAIAEDATHNIYGAIQVLLAAISSGADTGCNEHSPAIAAFSKKAVVNTIDWIKNVFDSIDLVFKKVEIPDGSCPAKFP